MMEWVTKKYLPPIPSKSLSYFMWKDVKAFLIDYLDQHDALSNISPYCISQASDTFPKDLIDSVWELIAGKMLQPSSTVYIYSFEYIFLQQFPATQQIPQAIRVFHALKELYHELQSPDFICIMH